MKVVDFENPVTNAWLALEGHRLDAPPFLSGAVEAKVRLEKLHAPKQPLKAVTKGGLGGIYNGPQFSRAYVQSREHGVPFVGSSSMLQSDLSDLPLISKRTAHSPKLRHLELREGMTLISCSGTIGRTVYVRPEMQGMWSSQHVMKVVPDPEAIPPGYLYAYLSSKYGKTLVTSGTYGAIIQHIEPEHIADLPVPRFGAEFEGRVHELVREAGELRSSASRLTVEAVNDLVRVAHLPSLSGSDLPEGGVAFINSAALVPRMDGAFHSRGHLSAQNDIESSSYGSVHVREIAKKINEPQRLKRIGVDEYYGIPFFGTSTLFDAEPEPSYHLSRNLASGGEYLINKTTVLIPRSGQVHGIIGNPVMPQGEVVGGMVSEHAIRVDFAERNDAGYVFAALLSSHGKRQLKARPFGSSILTLNVELIGSVKIPRLPKDERAAIGKKIVKTMEMRDLAIQNELKARRLVEQAIESDSQG